MEKKNISEVARSNGLGFWAHGIMAGIISLFYVKECVAGQRGVGYVALVIVLALTPVLAEAYFYGRDKETSMIKHLVGIGFAITYTFIMFTATTNKIYVFVIPMILAITIFNDFKYCIEINIGCVIVNTIAIIAGAFTGKMGYDDLDAAIIQFILMVAVGIYSVITAKISAANSNQKLQIIEEEHGKTESVLKGVMSVSEGMTKGIGIIYEKLDHLKEAADITKQAMQEVNMGSTDTAEAVQKQLTETNQIQEKVEQVAEASRIISENMEQTLKVLEAGNEDVSRLVTQVENSVESGADVAAKLETLDSYMSEMNSIVELIGGITSQTSLLALNASIEAARAGDAGRGFAVVASEISGMATQTKDATVHITKLIQDVSEAISQVVTVVREMIAEINEEKTSTATTAESFGKIEKNTNVIESHVKNLSACVGELQTANEQIGQSIQTISAISEEVSAHSNETYESEVKNAGILEEIANVADELKELTKQI